MLYRVKKPKIKSVAIVKSPASGNTWALFKSQPDELDRLADEAMAAWELAQQAQEAQRFIDESEPIRALRRVGPQATVLAKSAGYRVETAGVGKSWDE